MPAMSPTKFYVRLFCRPIEAIVFREIASMDDCLDGQSSFEKLPRDNRSGPPLDARRRAASTSRQKRRRRSPSRQSSWAKQSRMEAFRRCLRQSPATFGEIPTSTWIVVDWPMIDRFADVALDDQSIHAHHAPPAATP